jgi:hypothetical protein
MNSRPEYPQVRHQSLLLNIPGKNIAVQIFRVRNVDLGRKLEPSRQLVATCARTRVAAALPASSGALKPAATWRYADRDMRHSETGIYPPAPWRDTSDQGSLHQPDGARR